MPETQSANVPPKDHIAVARLLEMAESDFATFTNAEFYDIQTCSTCHDLWKEFIEDAEQPRGF
jgi:hypothetical protein